MTPDTVLRGANRLSGFQSPNSPSPSPRVQDAGFAERYYHQTIDTRYSASRSKQALSLPVSQQSTSPNPKGSGRWLRGARPMTPDTVLRGANRLSVFQSPYSSPSSRVQEWSETTARPMTLHQIPCFAEQAGFGIWWSQSVLPASALDLRVTRAVMTVTGFKLSSLQVSPSGSYSYTTTKTGGGGRALVSQIGGPLRTPELSSDSGAESPSFRLHFLQEPSHRKTYSTTLGGLKHKSRQLYQPRVIQAANKLTVSTHKQPAIASLIARLSTDLGRDIPDNRLVWEPTGHSDTRTLGQIRVCPVLLSCTGQPALSIQGNAKMSFEH
ncbi:hypothetical protein EGW08_016844 [Elysia chlorotica]|uniref:Uncharacterized protein n=1 Tax=Elysia chlorotica TaxID=188477 RepID=A0A433T1G8_ELYCH|nr:hypothetical protein EGW08_016844 [Elysia chlorotica]